MQKKPAKITRFTKERAELASRLRHIRANERQDICVWVWTHTPLGLIEKSFGVDFGKILNSIRERFPNKARKLRVLDLGCLDGTAISQIAERFGFVEAHGISLTRGKKWHMEKKVSWHVGHAQKTRLPSNHFDFVYSHFGITHSKSLTLALTELARIMAPKGEAIFNIDRIEHRDCAIMEQLLAERGLKLLSMETKGTFNDYRVEKT